MPPACVKASTLVPGIEPHVILTCIHLGSRGQVTRQGKLLPVQGSDCLEDALELDSSNLGNQGMHRISAEISCMSAPDPF